MTTLARADEVIVGGSTKDLVEEIVGAARAFILEHVAANIHGDVSSALLGVNNLTADDEIECNCRESRRQWR